MAKSKNKNTAGRRPENVGVQRLPLLTCGRGQASRDREASVWAAGTVSGCDPPGSCTEDAGTVQTVVRDEWGFA
jgi:hypothetical protein